MDNLINRLIRKNKTNCPYQIAGNLNINVWFEDLGKATRGMYYRKLRRRYAEWQRFICAHELGHDRLHPGLSRFWLDEHSLFKAGKYEREANKFAVQLLTAGEAIGPDETIIDLFRRSGIPDEILRFYL
jgi:hypothetical protein